MKTFLTCLLLALTGCITGERQTSTETLSPPSYSNFLSNFHKQRHASADSSVNYGRRALFSAINDSIPFYWKGTTWDFNGTTRQPHNGSIACGYFVTNVLTDLGFSLKRVYLAQQPSSVMIKALTTNIKCYTTITALKKYLLQQNRHDVFIIGLDFHTGFVTREDDKLWFIHSNYINAAGVVKEPLDESQALVQSGFFMAGSLLQNEKLIKEWMNE